MAEEPGTHGRREGVRLTLPLGVAVLGFGVSYGVLARSAGMGALAPVVMSATTFAGSAQFASASVLGAGGGVASAIAAAVLLNARYAPIAGRDVRRCIYRPRPTLSLRIRPNVERSTDARIAA